MQHLTTPFLKETPIMSGLMSGADLPDSFVQQTSSMSSIRASYTSTLQPWTWPSRLPPPDILHKLISKFFASVPLAFRIIHRPTFLASLSYDPSSPKFPALALLHSICAITSINSALVVVSAAGETCIGDLKKERGESFGELHAKYTKEEIEQLENNGERLFDSIQGESASCYIEYIYPQPVLDTKRPLF
jgi:hypothetical protein